MGSQSRKARGPQDDSGPSVAEEGPAQAPEASELLGNAALKDLVASSDDPAYLSELFGNSPMAETEILKQLGGKVDLDAAAQDGMGQAGAPPGWGRELGQYRGVRSYANGQGTSTYGLRGTYGYMYQCVEYVNRFAVEALNLPNMTRSGHAKDYWTKRPGLTYMKNQRDAYLPQPDDLLVFEGGTYGHVAIVTESSDSKIDFIHQNSSSAFSQVAVKGTAGSQMVDTWGRYRLLGWQTAKDAAAVARGSDQAQSQDQGGTYTVASGDSLSLIAGRVLGSTDRWPELASLNGLRAPYTLAIGQTLTLPGGEAGAEEEAPEQENLPEVEASSEQSTEPASSIDASADAEYVVQPGDSLWAIAAAQLGDGERWRELAQANRLRDPQSIEIGQTLTIPGLQTPVAADASSNDQQPERIATVQSGESLWVIAQRELGDGNRWTEIQRANGLNGTSIQPGQELKIPARQA